MKKLIFLFIFSLLLLYSCQNDDETPDACLTPSFTTELITVINGNSLYNFTPDFEVLDGTAIKEGYELAYYVDGALEYEPRGRGFDQGNFQHDFEPGTYEVCLKLSTTAYQLEQSFCESLVVSN